MLSAAFFRVDNFSMTKAGTKLDRQNMDSATRLQMILVDSPVGVVLPAIALLNLPNWWLAGGAVRNTIWRSRSAAASSTSLKGVVSETIITARIAPTDGQFQQLRVLVLLEFGVQRARFDKVP